MDEPRSIKSIRDNPNRLAIVYTEPFGGMYTHGHCNGKEVIEYIDYLRESKTTLDLEVIRRIAHVAAQTAIDRYVGNPKMRPDYRAAVQKAMDVAIRVEQNVERSNKHARCDV